MLHVQYWLQERFEEVGKSGECLLQIAPLNNIRIFSCPHLLFHFFHLFLQLLLIYGSAPAYKNIVVLLPPTLIPHPLTMLRAACHRQASYSKFTALLCDVWYKSSILYCSVSLTVLCVSMLMLLLWPGWRLSASGFFAILHSSSQTSVSVYILDMAGISFF